MARKFMLESREPFWCRFIKDESRETIMDVTKDKSEGAEKRVERDDDGAEKMTGFAVPAKQRGTRYNDGFDDKRETAMTIIPRRFAV